MHRTRHRRDIWQAACVAAVLALAPPAAADWLITLEGRLIETDGPWTVDGDRLTYTDLEGEEQTVALDDLDLEASEETTALRAGKPYVPQKESEEQPAAKAEKPGGEAAEPKIILYMTSLCKACSRARELLEDLGVDFVEKDVQTDKKARREYKEKAGHGGGLPVIDVGGALVFSNNPRVIRQRVKELQEREAEAAAKAREE